MVQLGHRRREPGPSALTFVRDEVVAHGEAAVQGLTLPHVSADRASLEPVARVEVLVEPRTCPPPERASNTKTDDRPTHAPYRARQPSRSQFSSRSPATRRNSPVLSLTSV